MMREKSPVEPKYKVLSASSTDSKIKIKPALKTTTITQSSPTVGKDIFSQDAYLKSKNNKKEVFDDDDFFGKEGVVEKQDINDEDFFNNDWDNEDDVKPKKQIGNNERSSSSSNLQRNSSYDNNNRYSGIGSSASRSSMGSSSGSYSPQPSFDASDRYRGIGPGGVSSSSDIRRNALGGVALSDMSSEQLAFYLTEQAKDLSSKTKEVSQYLGDQFQVVSQNVSDWWSSMMQTNEHK